MENWLGNAKSFLTDWGPAFQVAAAVIVAAATVWLAWITRGYAKSTAAISQASREAAEASERAAKATEAQAEASRGAADSAEQAARLARSQILMAQHPAVIVVNDGMYAEHTNKGEPEDEVIRFVLRLKNIGPGVALGVQAELRLQNDPTSVSPDELRGQFPQGRTMMVGEDQSVVFLAPRSLRVRDVRWPLRGSIEVRCRDVHNSIWLRLWRWALDREDDDAALLLASSNNPYLPESRSNSDQEQG